MKRTLAALAACLLVAPALALELNAATRAELEQLSGIGVAMADRVLDERARRPFRDWEDLQARVKGMRGARSERLQAQGVTVNGRARADGDGRSALDPLRKQERVR